jgi:hypothetical protein
MPAVLLCSVLFYE